MNRDLMVKSLVPSVMIGYRKGGTDEQMKRDEREDGVSTDSRLVLKASPAKRTCLCVQMIAAQATTVINRWLQSNGGARQPPRLLLLQSVNSRTTSLFVVVVADEDRVRSQGLEI